MAGNKILICDDIEAIRRLAARILENLGYVSVHAASGQEAIHKLSSDPDIRLVLLDIVLPDLSGFDVMKEIQKIRVAQKREIKVCFLSGKSTREDILKAIDLGGDDYIIKPIFSDTLGNKIQSLMGMPKGTTFARLNVLYQAALLEQPVTPDVFITEVSEEDLNIRSTAGLTPGMQFKIRSPDLAAAVEGESDFLIRIQTCHRQRSGLYFIKADFVGLTEAAATKLRSMAIRGSPPFADPGNSDLV